eukprot:15268403-Alexandrium_andersonii.AAC.1
MSVGSAAFLKAEPSDDVGDPASPAPGRHVWARSARPPPTVSGTSRADLGTSAPGRSQSEADALQHVELRRALP